MCMLVKVAVAVDIPQTVLISFFFYTVLKLLLQFLSLTNPFLISVVCYKRVCPFQKKKKRK